MRAGRRPSGKRAPTDRVTANCRCAVVDVDAWHDRAMHLGRLVSIAALVLGACSTSKSNGPSAAAGSAAKPVAAAPVAAGPPPPDGVILPKIGHARSMVAGDQTTAYKWKAVYEA